MIKINIFKSAKNLLRRIPVPWGYSPYDSYNVNYDLFVKQAYENPFITAPFNEFVTDLLTIEFEVHKNKEKSTSYSSKFVNKTLERPNEELSFSNFIRAIATYLVFGGRCLLYKTNGILSRNIYVFSPDSFQIIRDETNLKVKEIILGSETISGKDLEDYHIIKNFDPYDKIAGFGNGYSQIKPLAMVGDMLNFLMIHNCTLLKNGGRTSGIYTLPTNTPNSQIEAIKQAFSTQTGAKEAGKVAFVKSDTGSFTPFSTNPKDLDWVNGMIELQKIICRVLGIPEALVMNENSTYNNLEGFKKKVYQDTIIPFANMICEELTYFLRNDLDEGEYIAINTSNIKALQIDLAKEISEYAKALDGKITTNKFIEFINNAFDIAIPLLSAKEGDRVLVSANMMFLDELGMSYEPKQ